MRFFVNSPDPPGVCGSSRAGEYNNLTVFFQDFPGSAGTGAGEQPERRLPVGYPVPLIHRETGIAWEIKKSGEPVFHATLREFPGCASVDEMYSAIGEICLMMKSFGQSTDRAGPAAGILKIIMDEGFIVA
jgi:hypothetical protein